MSSAGPPTRAEMLRGLARDAWTRGQAAETPHDARRWLDRARRLAPTDGTVALSLATALLRLGLPAEAAPLFRAVAEEHDLAEGWLGLAACGGGAAALRAALSRHALTPAARALAPLLAGLAGWCGLDGAGRVTMLEPAPHARSVLTFR